jgi:hypothetical protein
MKAKYYIKLNRRMLALYLAWEHGICGATKRLNRPEAFGILRAGHWYYLDAPFLFPLKTLREAVAAENRIKQIITYQVGRLGKPLIGPDVYTVRM